jgi:hypothetical protein
MSAVTRRGAASLMMVDVRTEVGSPASGPPSTRPTRASHHEGSR